MARHTPCQSTSFFLFVRAVRSQIRTRFGSRGRRHCRGPTRTPLVYEAVLGASGSRRPFSTWRVFTVSGGKRMRRSDVISWYCLRPSHCSQQRPPVDEALREGHISLSGLQLRAHAMFSAEGLPLGSDSLEYAWLIDAQAGSLTAKVTAPQVRPPQYSLLTPFPFAPAAPRAIACPFGRSPRVPRGPPSGHGALAFWTNIVLGIQHFLSNR